MNELIDHILYIAQNNKKKITHLQLHKIAYFAFGYLIQNNYDDIAKSLYETEQFEAWLYGPVLPNVYEKFKSFNNLPILDNGKKSKCISKIPSMNKIISNLMSHDPFDLVYVSHKHYFWKHNKEKILNNHKPIYTYKVLKEEFSN